MRPSHRRTPVRAAAASAGLVLSAALLLGACSTEETPAAPDDPQLQRGEQVYATRCAGCHGATGGGGAGVKLSGRVEEAYPDIDDQIAVIVNGRSSMPAFGGSLSPEDIEAVAEYTRQVL